MKKKVLVAEFPGVCLNSLHGLELNVRPELAEDRAALLRTVPGYSGLIVRNRIMVDATLLSAAQNLRVIGRLGAGLDNIDLRAARGASIPVVYSPDTPTNAVIEYCLGQIINLLRRIPEVIQATAAGQWDRTPFRALELRDSVIGVIGYGRIGRGVAEVAGALGAEVLVHSRPEVPVSYPARSTDLGVLLSNSDLITIHIPGRRENDGFLGAPEFTRMKRGSLLLNASRGSVIDENALTTALESGHLGAAALDVRAIEPPGRERLSIMPNVYQTPHLAGLTEGSMMRTAESVLSDVEAVLNGRSPCNLAPE